MSVRVNLKVIVCEEDDRKKDPAWRDGGRESRSLNLVDTQSIDMRAFIEEKNE